MFIVAAIIFTLTYLVLFNKVFKGLPNLITIVNLIIGEVSLFIGIWILKDDFMPMVGWVLIVGGAYFVWLVLDGTYKNYKIEKNTAEVVERIVKGVVKTKNCRTNIKTVNNNVSSTEEYHTVIKLVESDHHDNFINFYDYNTFMTLSEGEEVTLKNIRKLDKDKKILASDFWVV